MVDLELFFPEDDWDKDASYFRSIWRSGAFGAGAVEAALGYRASPIVGFWAIPFYLVFVQPTIIVATVQSLLERQKEKKIRAVMSAFGDEYTFEHLNDLFTEDRSEFNRLYRLASDEFFREYFKEQADHLKAQELITRLQAQIDHMREKLSNLEKKFKKPADIIDQLTEEIATYEEIVANWAKAA